MSRRNLSVPGISYVEVNGGRVSTYTVDSDVLEAHRRIEALYPELKVRWDNETQEHLVIESCLDGVERLVFATPTFHEEHIRARLDSADHTRADPFLELEKYNASVEASHEAKYTESAGDFGERLAHAFAKDGLTVRPKVFIGEGISNR